MSIKPVIALWVQNLAIPSRLKVGAKMMCSRRWAGRRGIEGQLRTPLVQGCLCHGNLLRMCSGDVWGLIVTMMMVMMHVWALLMNYHSIIHLRKRTERRHVAWVKQYKTLLAPSELDSAIYSRCDMNDGEEYFQYDSEKGAMAKSTNKIWGPELQACGRRWGWGEVLVSAVVAELNLTFQGPAQPVQRESLAHLIMVPLMVASQY